MTMHLLPSVTAALLLLGINVATAASLRSDVDLLGPRAAHTATRLADGRVLLAGGCRANGCEEGIADDAVIFDPASQEFSVAGTLRQARVGHHAIRLDDGSVLLIGGWTVSGASASIERFDTSRGTFEIHGAMLQARDAFTATRLADGRILIVGGYDSSMRRLADAELYDPATGRSTVVGGLAVARKSHTATLLGDGRVLIAGGSDARTSVTASLEVFDPKTKQFSAAGSLAKARQKHAAVVVNGKVLILGGAGMPESNTHYADSEFWDPRTGTVTTGPTMSEGRYKFLDTVVTLANGDVLVAGGGRHAERLDVRTMRFSPLATAIGTPLAFATATPLCNGTIWIAGGYDPDIRVSRGSWIFDTADTAPSARASTPTSTTETPC